MKTRVLCAVMLLIVILTGCCSNTNSEDNLQTQAPVVNTVAPTEKITVDYDLNEELAAVEAKCAEISEDTAEMTQAQMSIMAARLFEAWDDELNSLWMRYISLLDDNARAAAVSEENSWIAKKEAEVKSAGEQYEGGSMRPMVMSDTAKNLTRERCYVIAGYIGDIVGQTVTMPNK